MNSSETLTLFCSLKSLLALAVLWYLLLWLYRDFRGDVFRQELFALRDRLFDLATDRSLDYDHPAYGTLRRTINGFIRFGHRLTLNQVILLAVASRYGRTGFANSFDVRWDRVATDLPASLRLEMEGVVRAMHKAVLKHLIFGSPLLVLAMTTVIVPVVLVLIAWRFSIDRLIRWFGERLRWVDSVAVAYGA